MRSNYTGRTSGFRISRREGESDSEVSDRKRVHRWFGEEEYYRVSFRLGKEGNGGLSTKLGTWLSVAGFSSTQTEKGHEGRRTARFSILFMAKEGRKSVPWCHDTLIVRPTA